MWKTLLASDERVKGLSEGIWNPVPRSVVPADMEYITPIQPRVNSQSSPGGIGSPPGGRVPPPGVSPLSGSHAFKDHEKDEQPSPYWGSDCQSYDDIDGHE